MKTIIAAMVIAPLMLAGALPAFAAPSTQIAATADDGKADRASYSDQARKELLEWRRKLQVTADQGKAEGRQAGAAAEAELNLAWAKADSAAHKLEVAGAADWDMTKAAYEAASHDLAETWHRNHPDNK